MENKNSELNTTVESQISMFSERVSVKIPALWKNNMKLWFLQVENQFKLANINSESTKYSYVISKLEQEHIEQLSDILLDDSVQGNYSKLKIAILKRMGTSPDVRREKLFSSLQLGDRLPSTLLREIKMLAIDLNMDSETIRFLWNQQLPRHVQAHIAVSNASLEELAEIADRLIYVYSGSSVDSVNGTKKDTELEASVNSLTEKVEKLISCKNNREEPRDSHLYNNFNNNRYQNTCRNYRHFYNNGDNFNTGKWNNYRFNNNNVSHRNNFNNRIRVDSDRNSTNYFCHYHKRYGSRSFKCIQPCNFDHQINQKN